MRQTSKSLRSSPAAWILHLGLLFAPACILALAALRHEVSHLGLAAVAAVASAIVLLRAGPAWRPPVSGVVALGYLVVLILLWWLTRGTADPLLIAARGLLLLIAALLVAAHDLQRTGAEPRRQARKACSAIQARSTWPSEMAEVRNLPEVRLLMDAARVEPGPVFDLLRDPRPQVRAAAFASLPGNRVWRPRELNAILDAARATPEPAVRTMAMVAFAGIDDPMITQGLIEFYRDPSVEVRAAAMWATLGDGGRRWAFARDSVRGWLSDPHVTDQAIPGVAGIIPAVAVCDLTTWAAEPEPLGSRSVRTLIDHYSVLLQTTADYDLITDLTNQVLDASTATMLRVELAAMLRQLGMLTPELLDRLSNADQPGAVRLLAAEALLELDPNHVDGLDVLRGLGRQPNREMALAIAKILQQRLGLDLGMPPEGLNPNSKAAGEVAKKVMAWAIMRAGDRRLTPSTPSRLPFGAPAINPTTPGEAKPGPIPMPKFDEPRSGPW